MTPRASVPVALLLTAVAVYAQAPASANSEGFVTGVITVLGVLLAAVIVLAAKLRSIVRQQVREDVDARLLDDESAFGKHRVDQYAHEPMRRQIMTELRAELDKLSASVKAFDEHHQKDMQAMTKRLDDVVKPLIEQSRVAMSIMQTQMRRQPPTDGDEP